MTELLPWLSFFAVLASLAVAGLSYVRAGRWKDSEDAATLIKRVGQCEGDIAGLKAGMDHVATKADVASLKAELRGQGNDIRSIERGVERIEGYMMKERA